MPFSRQMLKALVIDIEKDHNTRTTERHRAHSCMS